MARQDRKNLSTYWWDKHVSGLSLMRADFTSHDYPSHTHDAFVIAITDAGGSRFKSRGTVETMHPSMLFVSNPEEPQSAWMGDSTRWRYRSIYLTRPAIETIARGLGIETVPYFTRNTFDDADLIRDFGRLHRTLEAGCDPFLEQECLIGTFGTLFRRHGSGGARIGAAPRDRTIVRSVVDRMRDRYAETLLLDELAGAVGLSPFQLIGLFKRTVGLTPHAYLIHIRLNMACRFLRRGLPPAQAALDAGFSDQSALTKHFKRWYAITPLQFTAAARPAIFANTARGVARKGGGRP
jgi:AraC-like DNA-binding protein